jgi:2-polyprenyl-6-methoxyphenol hydroxylase-like FAD-dependent oxidoreductase
MDWDCIAVGGGLAGSALGIALAREGRRVLVLEREKSFRDRVRGEVFLPWGVNELRDLGLYDEIVGKCAHPVRYWTSHARGPSRPRDLEATCPREAHCLHFLHPDLQETLIAAAEDTGAEVRRGVVVTKVEPGQKPKVTMGYNGKEETLSASLVVGADGRTSKVRGWCGFEADRDPERMVVAGCLLEGTDTPHDSVHIFRREGHGEGALVFPISRDRLRIYFLYRKLEKRRGLSGASKVATFIESCKRVGVPSDWLARAKACGPLAEFDGADLWVKHPYRDGVALVGDAASANDPSWGNGLSLAVRDVRTLVDQLLATDDLNQAGRSYAETHDRYFGRLNQLTRWLTDLNYEIGPEADALRARAIPLIREDPTRVPDYISYGPDSPSDEMVRKRLFGEV